MSDINKVKEACAIDRVKNFDGCVNVCKDADKPLDCVIEFALSDKNVAPTLPTLSTEPPKDEYKECLREFGSNPKAAEMCAPYLNNKTGEGAGNNERAKDAGVIIGLSSFYTPKISPIKDMPFSESEMAVPAGFLVEACGGYGKFGPGFTADILGCLGVMSALSVKSNDNHDSQESSSGFSLRAKGSIGYIFELWNNGGIGIVANAGIGYLSGLDVDDGSIEGARANTYPVFVGGKFVVQGNEYFKISAGYDYIDPLCSSERTYQGLDAASIDITLQLSEMLK